MDMGWLLVLLLIAGLVLGLIVGLLIGLACCGCSAKFSYDKDK
jgi:hypothetical protein